METIKLTTPINADGILTIEVPNEFRDREAEILIVLNPLSSQKPLLDVMGYPIGYFETTFGILADDPIERGEQGDYEYEDWAEN